jgi:hypothetical protein
MIIEDGWRIFRRCMMDYSSGRWLKDDGRCLEDCWLIIGEWFEDDSQQLPA